MISNMGYHILLRCTTTIKPEFVDHIKLDYFWYGLGRDDDEDRIPDVIREYYSIWQKLHIHHDGNPGFYQFEMKGDQFTFEMCHRPYFYPSCHSSTYITLEDDYKRFMLYFIAPLSSEITYCAVEHDDIFDRIDTYTDEEVRDFHIT